MFFARQEERTGGHGATEQTINGGRRRTLASRRTQQEVQEEEDLPDVPDVRGLQGGGVQRLDPGAAGLRRVLLSRRVRVPVGQPHERHQPRGHADADELGEPGGRATGVLRAHPADRTDVALRGRRRQDGAEELSGNGRGRVRLQITVDDDDDVRCYHSLSPAGRLTRTRVPCTRPSGVCAEETPSRARPPTGPASYYVSAATARGDETVFRFRTRKKKSRPPVHDVRRVAIGLYPDLTRLN